MDVKHKPAVPSSLARLRRCPEIGTEGHGECDIAFEQKPAGGRLSTQHGKQESYDTEKIRYGAALIAFLA